MQTRSMYIVTGAASVTIGGIMFYGHYTRRPWARTLTLVLTGAGIVLSGVGIAIAIAKPELLGLTP
jgi:hypothetical protein